MVVVKRFTISKMVQVENVNIIVMSNLGQSLLITTADYHYNILNKMQYLTSNNYTNVNNIVVEREKDPFLKRILVVDDDSDITLTFKISLEEHDPDRRFEVYTYNNPLVAMGEFKSNFYDLMLTDINMPHISLI